LEGAAVLDTTGQLIKVSRVLKGHTHSDVINLTVDCSDTVRIGDSNDPAMVVTQTILQPLLNAFKESDR
jgi:hypothetical protein